MKLRMNIKNIKCIDDLTIELPIDKGLYAITGQNGSGKSTIVTCASSVFYMMKMKDYFGKPDSNSSIHFQLGESTREYKTTYNQNGTLVWRRFDHGSLTIRGFYEGSLIFGNRFRNTTIEKLRTINNSVIDKLVVADPFILRNLGLILQGNENFYNNLSIYEVDELSAPIFFYERNGKRISQFHMSTGENLLLSILYSLHKRIMERNDMNIPCLILLDEIELALHPASLRRLTTFLSKIAEQYNYAIYFSTHSIELIGSIPPENIYFINRHIDNTYHIINPCYPAYATRILFDHDGYDKVFLVEDDLAKLIVTEILRKEKLLGNKLVHVLPCGGFSNVIDLAYDVVRFNLLTKKASVAMILDKDIEAQAKGYIRNKGMNFNVPISYLPIESLEKFLKTHLVDKVDHTLYQNLDSYLFQTHSLKNIIEDYVETGKDKNDGNGKKLFAMIDEGLSINGYSRKDLIDIVTSHIYEHKKDIINDITVFLCDSLGFGKP